METSLLKKLVRRTGGMQGLNGEIRKARSRREFGERGRR
jgi:hypothetical protein